MTGRSGLILAAFMGATGLTHFTALGYYRGLVPTWLPHARDIVVASGLLDIGAATLLALPATRSLDARATAALIAAYLPVHLDAAVRARGAAGLYAGPVGAAARIVVNLGYIAWALRVGTDAPPARRGRADG